MCGCARRSSCVKEPEQRSERWKDPISSSITGSRAWTHFVRFTRQAESSRPSPALLCHRRLYRMEKSQQSTTDSKHDSQKLRSEWKKGVFLGGGHLNQFYFCLSLHALMYICCMVYIICRKSGRVDAQNCSKWWTHYPPIFKEKYHSASDLQPKSDGRVHYQWDGDQKL